MKLELHAAAFLMGLHPLDVSPNEQVIYYAHYVPSQEDERYYGGWATMPEFWEDLMRTEGVNQSTPDRLVG